MTMDSAEFETLIASYGSKLARWPDAQRDAMLAFCEAHPTSRALLGHEVALDDLLDARLPNPPKDLEARILQDMTIALVMDAPVIDTPVMEMGSTANSPQPQRATWLRFGLAMAACLVAGVLSGPIVIDVLLDTVLEQNDLFAALLN